MNTLFARCIVALMGILASVGLAFVAITRWTTDRYHEEVTQRLNKTIADYVVAENLLIDENGINTNALTEIAHMVMIINPSIEVYLLDPSGRIIGHALPEDAIANRTISLQPLTKFIDNPDQLPIYGDDPRHPGATKVFSAAPVIDQSGATIGYLYAVLGGEKHVAAVQGMRNSLIIKIGVLSIVALIIFALLTGLFVFYLLTRRLNVLAGTFRAFRENGFSQVIPAKHRQQNGDEIDDLASTFNHMSQRIVSQMHELRQTDLRRRELMQNVSHDLRTPLASMQGYIDTLQLKFSELDDQQKQDYLLTASKHGKYLSKLVKELFELSNLDSGILRINPEPFSMAELAHDIVHKFKLDAAKKDVSLEVVHSKDLSMVNADISMLERVLENLIDNALRHTQPSGQIKVSLRKKNDSIITTVVDNGRGISSADLPRIFERSFVAQASGSNRQQGSGLGLAIVKKILDLHNSEIEVASKLGKGTMVSFGLKQA